MLDSERMRHKCIAAGRHALDGCAMHLHMQAGGCAVESKPVGTTVGAKSMKTRRISRLRGAPVGRWGAFVGG